MSYPSAAHTYREADVMSATPERLVVITFDFLLVSLQRAKVGMTQSQPEIYLPALDRARNAIGELLGALDRERGGEIAERLSAIYAFTIQELGALGLRPNPGHLDRHVQQLQVLRDAFAQASGATRAQVA